MYKNEAIKKLDDESKESVNSNKANAIKNAVVTALKDFCSQDEKFAQAVVQSDKKLKDCLLKVVGKCGNAISDIECYRRAVAFYFPGAKVNMVMTIDLIGDAKEETTEKSNIIKLDIMDLFGGDE